MTMKIKPFPALLVLAAILLPASALAHFPFLHWTSYDDRPALQIYFGEAPTPGNPQFLDHLVDGAAWTKPADGKTHAITLERTGDYLLARPQVDGPVAFGYQKTWGTYSHAGKSFVLVYYAKTFSGPKAWSIDTTKQLALDIRPVYDPKTDSLTVTALWQGKPLPNAEIVVQGGVAYYEGKTDAHGHYTCELVHPALYAIRVRHIEHPQPKTDEPARRHYATATIELEEK